MLLLFLLWFFGGVSGLMSGIGLVFGLGDVEMVLGDLGSVGWS